MVTNTEVPYKELCPAHLVKHSTPALMAAYGLSPGLIDNPRNGILILKTIELEFDHKNVCFVRNPITNVIHLRVLNPDINTKRVHPTSVTELRTFADLNDAQLLYLENRWPYRRIPYMHAKFSFARALQHGWIADSAVLDNYFAVSEA